MAESCPAPGATAAIHCVYLLGAALLLAYDWHVRVDKDRPHRKEADWALALGRFVCRRPVAICGVATAYCLFLSLVAFVDLDCGGFRSLKLVTALAESAAPRGLRPLSE